MHLQEKIEPVLMQLSTLLQELTAEQYIQKSTLLNGSSIGGHTRHVIELFQCLLNGYNTGVVNYELRKRDIELETNKDFASIILSSISQNIVLDNINIQLEGFYTDAEKNATSVNTNFNRELIYNLEHCIHHMALIRVAVNEVSNVQLPIDFGVAAATIQYKKLCVQ
jgi:hypothetical protein